MAIKVADSILADSKSDQDGIEVVFARKYATPSNDFLGEKFGDAYSRNLRAALKNKVYWLVYYAPPSSGLGGDLAVFVEDKSWKVLGLYKGK